MFSLGFRFSLTLSGFALRSAGAVLTGPGGSSPPDTDSAEYGNFSAWPVPVPALSPYQDSEELSGAYAPPPRSGDFSRLRERKLTPPQSQPSPYKGGEEPPAPDGAPPRSGDFSRLRERKHKPERKRQSRE